MLSRESDTPGRWEPKAFFAMTHLDTNGTPFQ